MNRIHVLLVIVLFSGVSCSKFLGSLRKDLDDTPPRYEPTVGGVWPEGGMLEDPYAAVGHVERSPAGMVPSGAGGPQSWVSGDQLDANRRDQVRPSYGQNPNMPPATKRLYQEGARATRADFVDSSSNEGSLWASNGQTNYFFIKNKIKGVGDIITITVEDRLVSDVALEIKKTLDQKEVESEIKDAQDRLNAAAAPKGGKPAPKKEEPSALAGVDVAAASKEPASAKEEEKEPEVREANYNDIEVGKNLDIKAGEIMMGEIIERYPNGNYKVRATKRVPYRGGMRLVQLLGIAKSTDINEQDVIGSSKLYEYRIAAFK